MFTNVRTSFFTLHLLFSCAWITANSVPLALSYDDVLLVPQHSSIMSRQDPSLKTRLTRNITINSPLVSANMDTVTESEMAIAMALRGGIGIIHRFNTIEQQVLEVGKVKRYRNAIIEHPFTVSHGATLAQAKQLIDQYGISGILVLDDEKKLTGILTHRDLLFQEDNSLLVRDCMTPREQLVVAKAGITIEQAKQLFMKHRIEKLPLIHDDWSLAGLITSKDVHHKIFYPHAALDMKNRLLVGAAIGVKDDSLDRAAALVKAEVDVLVIDIAHGHSDLALETVRKVKAAFPHVDVIAGNVVTAQAVADLVAAGADAIKVGVGPGSICTTRIVTGCGYPQFSAVLDCAREAEKHNVPIIADGGIKYSGDITKAIAAGASTVMLGRLLAGTDESPGQAFVKNGKKFKVIRGMASLGAHLGREAKQNNTNASVNIVPEGVEGIIPYQGSVMEVIAPLLGGLRSGMSYCGVQTIEQMRGKIQFVRITSSGARESHAHDVTQV